MAEQFRQAGKDVQAMFTNDIVGSSTADDGERDPRSLRLFAEGVPTDETPEEANTRRSVGGENDSPARQLARFVTEVAGRDTTGMDVRVIYRRDRYLRGGDHIPFLERGFPAARFTEPNEDYAHQHQDVRVENGKQYGDLPRFCDFGYIARTAQGERRDALVAGHGAGHAQGRQGAHRRAHQRHRAHLGGDAGRRPRYEVVWRPTVEDDWTQVIRVGDVTTHPDRPVQGQRVLRRPLGRCRTGAAAPRRSRPRSAERRSPLSGGTTFAFAGASLLGSVDAVAVPAVPAVPVQAQHGGVVAERVAGRLEDAVGQGADRLPRVQRPGVGDRRGQVDVRRRCARACRR